MLKTRTIGIIAILFLFTACYDKNMAPVNELGFYRPEFSIPIGTPDLNLEQYLELIQLIPVPDTSSLPDSLIIYYEDKFWENPHVLQYSFDQAFSLAVENNDSPVSSIMFRVNARNHVPAHIEIQVYFIADEIFVLDSLYETRLVLDAAQINEQGEVVAPYELFKKDAFIDEQKLELFNQVSSLRIYTRLIIDDIEGVDPKYYSNQSVWLQFAARVQLNINLDE